MKIPNLAARDAALLFCLVLAACGKTSDSTAPAGASVSAGSGAESVAAKPATPSPAAEAAAPVAAKATPSGPAAGGALYQVVDGVKVDAETMKGFRTWRAAACDRCHGANQEGMVGPSLIASLKVLSKDDFIKTVTQGRLEKGMPSFGGNPGVIDNINQLYAYLKGRSDGAITQAKVEPLP